MNLIRKQNFQNYYMDPEFVDLQETFSLSTHIGYEGFLKGTKQKVFVKKALTNEEIQKHINNYTISNMIKSEAIASVYKIYGRNQEFILMPYYTEKSIEYQINNENETDEKYLNQNIKFNIAYGIANVLKSSHENNVLHLNIKPSNVLLDSYRRAKICDFGIKKQFTKEELMELPLTTLIYMAPELLNCDQGNQKSDVYSYGLLLLFLFTGKQPFENIQKDDKLSYINGRKDFQISLNKNDFINQEYMYDIIFDCISFDPNERPTFKEIFHRLYAASMEIGNMLFQNYNLAINSQSLKLPTHFQQLKIIADVPEEKDDVFEFCIETFLYVLSDYKDNYISVIFLCGPHQQGKSTIARGITGNQAFYSGIGTNGTTKKILMDTHGYTIDELRKRISPSLYSYFDEQVNAIKCNLKPVFFIIDSIGGGDQNYEYFKSIIDRLNSIFASISTVCISINAPNNNNDETKHYFRMIRKGQMISEHNFIPDVILGMRNLPETIIPEMIVNTHNTYQRGMKMLNEMWFGNGDHQNILSQYEKNSLSVMPLPNPNISMDSYMFATSEIVIKMLNTTVNQMNKISKPNFGEIIIYSSRLSSYLIKPEYDEILKQLEINFHKPPYCASELCNFFSMKCQEKIKETITIGDRENPNKDEIEKMINELKNFINVYISIYLPIFLAESNIPFNEFIQIILDLYVQSTSCIKAACPKWINEATFKKIPPFPQIEDKERVDPLRVISDGFDAGIEVFKGFFGGSIVLGSIGAVIGAILCCFPPLIPVGSTIACSSVALIVGSPVVSTATGTLGAVAGMVISSIDQKEENDKKNAEKMIKKQDEIRNLQIQQSKLQNDFNETLKSFVFYYPLIWDKRNDELKWDEFNSKIISNKKITFILFIGDKNINYVLKSFTGSIPPKLNMVATIKNKQLLNRFAKIDEKCKEKTQDDFSIIYCEMKLADITLGQMIKKKIPKSNMMIIYTLTKDEQLPHFSRSSKCDFHLLFLLNDESSEPYTSDGIENLSKENSIKYQVQNFNTIFHPICAKSLDFEQEGPKCNTTIKEAFHSILFE